MSVATAKALVDQTAPVKSDPARAEARRAEIITAALALFYERDVDAVSIRDLERATQLTRGAIYYYFDSKEAVYQAALVEGNIAFAARLHAERDAAGSRAVDQMNALIGMYADEYTRNRPTFALHLRFYFGAHASEVTEPTVLREMNAAVASCLALLRSVIELGVEQGDFVCDDLDFATMTIWGVATTVVQMTPENERMAMVARPADQLRRGLQVHVLRGLGYRDSTSPEEAP
jgi:AcrR family transcriptional regulator